MKLQGPDYKDLPKEIALVDFKQRISNYEKVYSTISEDEERAGYSYIKIIDVGSKIIANRIKGYLPSQCVFYLMQMVLYIKKHIVKRTIWLSSHGESTYNKQGRIGGNPALTEKGKAYSKALFEFIDQNTGEPVILNTKSAITKSRAIGRSTRVLCSTLKRSIETVQPFTDAGYEVGSVKYFILKIDS